MGFDSAKKEVLEALRQRKFFNEPRSESEKNLLETGEVTIEEAIRLVESTRGNQATNSSHHFNPSIVVWVFKPKGWYIKFYFANGCWFISFHPTEGAS